MLLDFKSNLQEGPRDLADGEAGSVRCGEQGDVLVSQLHGKYYETAVRGNVFWLHNGIVAIAANAADAGFATKHILGRNSLETLIALWNPPGSGIAASLLHCIVVRLRNSGGALRNQYYFNYLPYVENLTQEANPVGIRNGLLSAKASSRVVPMYSTGLSSSDTIYVAPIGSAQPTLKQLSVVGMFNPSTSLANAGVASINHRVDGSIALLPGAFLSVQCESATTAFDICISLSWEEVPI